MRVVGNTRSACFLPAVAMAAAEAFQSGGNGDGAVGPRADGQGGDGSGGVGKRRSIPTRAEVPEDLRWRVEDIFATDEEWSAGAESVEQLIAEAARFRGRIGDSSATLLAALKHDDVLSEQLDRLIAYARLRLDENTGDAASQARWDRAVGLAVGAQSAFSSFRPEVLAIPPDRLEGFFREEGGLESYRFAIEEITRQREHVLSPDEEQILAGMSEVAHGPQQIFSMLNNADILFPRIRDESGEEVEVTKGNYVSFLESADRRVRRDAFEALFGTYWKQRNTIAAIQQANVKKDAFYAKTRRYPSARAGAMDGDNIPVEVYDNLIETVHGHLEPLHRYVSLRKQLLQLDEVHVYDLYAPLVRDVQFPVPFEDALEQVEVGLSPLGEAYIEQLRKGLNSRWLDVVENRGKRSGAYSMGVYGVHPFILLNYQDNVNSLFTIAHEMGHAMHSYYSNTHQPFRYADYTIFVAEVASTLNEALLMNHLLRTTSDPKRKLYLLNHQLDQFRGTLFRQTLFAEFEHWTHQQVEAEQPLTVESMNEEYRRLTRMYYGPDFVHDELLDLEWARIPHFYNAFYVYKYATGVSAATFLAKRILEEGEPAVDRYLELLCSGGSDYSLNLLKRAGVDMRSPEPIREAIGTFDSLLDELQRTAGASLGKESD